MTRFSLRPLALVAALSPVCVHAADVPFIEVDPRKENHYTITDGVLNIIPDGTRYYFPTTFKNSALLIIDFEGGDGTVVIHGPLEFIHSETVIGSQWSFFMGGGHDPRES